jgi:hypothetical protein
VNRAHVDGLDGWLGGLRRHFIERAARRYGSAALDEQRRRIEAWRGPDRGFIKSEAPSRRAP